MTQLENDAIGRNYPKATAKMAEKPYYATYLTYQEWQNLVAKYSGPDHWGYHGHYTTIYEPVENKFIGMIGILFHNSPMEQEYLVTCTPTTGAHDQPNWANRPVQTYWLTDADEAYALMIAIAYPCMEMWESILNGGDKDAAIQKYLDMVPGWCNFTEEQMTQFVKNLGG